jgi:hypothetical protein
MLRSTVLLMNYASRKRCFYHLSLRSKKTLNNVKSEGAILRVYRVGVWRIGIRVRRAMDQSHRERRYTEENYRC